VDNSVGLGSPPGEIALHFVVVLVWTLLTGVAWNVGLGVYMGVIYGVQRLCRRMPVGRPGEICMACGYDLRMSRGACPGCGTAIPGGGGATDSLFR